MLGIVLLFIAWQAMKMAVGEAPFTLRGKIPPSHEYRMEKLRQKASSGGPSVPTSRTGRYFAGIVDEAINRRHAKAAAKTTVKSTVAAAKAERIAADKVTKLTDRWDRKAAKKEAKRSGPDGPGSQSGPDRTFPDSTAGADARPAGTPIAVPANLEKFDQPAAEESSTEPEQPAPTTDDQPAAVEEAPEDPTAAEPDPEPMASVLPMPSRSAVLASAETTSLARSLDYFGMLIDHVQVVMETVQTMGVGLQNQGDVSGDVIDGLGQCYAALEVAAAELVRGHAELGKQTAIKEVYTDDAGTESFIKEA